MKSENSEKQNYAKTHHTRHRTGNLVLNHENNLIVVMERRIALVIVIYPY